MNPESQKIGRMWLGCHAVGLASVIVLVIGGLVGQTCPAISVYGSLKTGPFAYGDGATTEIAALLLMAAYALGAVWTMVNTKRMGRYPFAVLIRSALNVVSVFIVLLCGLVLSAGQSQRSTLCDATVVRTLVAWLVAATIGLTVLNWPFGRTRKGGKPATDEDLPFVDD